MASTDDRSVPKLRYQNKSFCIYVSLSFPLSSLLLIFLSFFRDLRNHEQHTTQQIFSERWWCGDDFGCARNSGASASWFLFFLLHAFFFVRRCDCKRGRLSQRTGEILCAANPIAFGLRLRTQDLFRKLNVVCQTLPTIKYFLPSCL